jgi:hypothetical protein
MERTRLTDDEYKLLLLSALERWKKDPKDTKLIDLYVGSMILDVIEQEMGI